MGHFTSSSRTPHPKGRLSSVVLRWALREPDRSCVTPCPSHGDGAPLSEATPRPRNEGRLPGTLTGRPHAVCVDDNSRTGRAGRGSTACHPGALTSSGGGVGSGDPAVPPHDPEQPQKLEKMNVRGEIRWRFTARSERAPVLPSPVFWCLPSPPGGSVCSLGRSRGPLSHLLGRTHGLTGSRWQRHRAGTWHLLEPPGRLVL